MKFELAVQCECGNKDTIIPHNNKVVFEDKVYEDYTSITDGVDQSNTFEVKQHQPDEVTFTCNKCGREHNLST